MNHRADDGRVVPIRVEAVVPEHAPRTSRKSANLYHHRHLETRRVAPRSSPLHPHAHSTLPRFSRSLPHPYASRAPALPGTPDALKSYPARGLSLALSPSPSLPSPLRLGSLSLSRAMTRSFSLPPSLQPSLARPPPSLPPAPSPSLE